MSGSGGGGGSGKADWPDYMKTWHESWLGEIDVLIGAASNPYTAVTAYNPDTALAAMSTAISAYWSIMSGTDIEAKIYDLIYDIADTFYDKIYSSELGPISATIYDANLVQSSAYAIANMLALQNATETAMRSSIPLLATISEQFVTGPATVLQATLDVNKTKIIAKSEEAEKNLEIEIHEETWPVDLYAYAGNMLAAIGGGRGGGSTMPKPDKTRSAIGGAMTGAAAGAAFGGVGAIAGAVIGGVAGYMMAS